MKTLPKAAENRRTSDDVAERRGVPPPGRLRQGAGDGHPHQDPEAKEAGMLEGVQRRAGEDAVIEGREMPEDQVGGPQRERQPRQRRRAQPAQATDGQQRLEHRACEAEHQQQSREVADHQVLDHVRPDQVVCQARDWREQRDQDQGQAQSKRELAPGGHRRPAGGESRGALRVCEPNQRYRQKL